MVFPHNMPVDSQEDESASEPELVVALLSPLGRELGHVAAFPYLLELERVAAPPLELGLELEPQGGEIDFASRFPPWQEYWNQTSGSSKSSPERAIYPRGVRKTNNA